MLMYIKWNFFQRINTCSYANQTLHIVHVITRPNNRYLHIILYYAIL